MLSGQASHPDEIAFWRKQHGSTRWALFENGTAVKVPLATTSDDVANRAIAVISGLEDYDGIGAQTEWVPASPWPHLPGTTYSAGWVVGPFAGVPAHVYVKADAAQSADNARQQASRRLQADMAELRIVFVSTQ